MKSGSLCIVAAARRGFPALAIVISMINIQAAVLQWTGASGNGSWHNPANWSPAGPPGQDDDVLLGLAARDNVITLSNVGGEVDIRGFTNLVPVTLELSGTTLRIRGEVELSTGFQLRAERSDVSMVNPGILLSQGGPPSGFTMRTNSTLAITSLTQISGSGGFGWSFIAESGARIDLPELPKVNGVSTFSAIGSQSVINLPKVADVNYVQLIARDGGSLHIPQLQNLNASGVIRRAGGYIDLAQLQMATAGDFQLDATNITFTALSTIDGSTWNATQGCQLSFPSITEWLPVAVNQLYARGDGSLLEFPNLEFIVCLGNNTSFQGLNGGRIRFPNLTEIRGAVYLRAGDRRFEFLDPNRTLISGLNVIISCDRLETIVGAVADCSFGGQILLPKLSHATATTFLGLRRTYPQTMLAVETLESCPESRIVVSEGMTLTFGSLTNADNAAFQVSEGGKIALSQLKIFNGSYAGDYSFLASGAGSEIHLSALETMTTGVQNGSPTQVKADASGIIVADQLRSIDGSTGGSFRFEAQGLDSKIQLPLLSNMLGSIEPGYPTLAFTTRNGGLISLGETVGGVETEGTGLYLVGGNNQQATIRAPRLLLGRGSILAGSGHFVGDLVVNEGAEVAVMWPGGAQAINDRLFVDGNIEQRPGGNFGVTLFNETAAPTPLLLRQIRISGKARIGGGLSVAHQRPQRAVQLGDSFPLITWSDVEGEFSVLRGLDGMNGLELEPSYVDPQQFFLVARGAAAPSVLVHTPISEARGLVDSVSITFSEAVLPEEFTSADITLKNPNGQIIPALSPMPDPAHLLGGPKFIIPFQAQTNQGIYTVTVGPNVLDFARIPMAEPFEWSFELLSGSSQASPSLQIAYDDVRGKIVFTWPGSAEGYSAQSSGNIAGTFSDVAVSPSRVGEEWSVEVDASGVETYFRLYKSE